MKLYKYKSFSNFEFVADILINNQLYASHFEELNDPMEGDFDSSYTGGSYAKQLKESLDEVRICSLSKQKDNPILWAHYADGFKGVCIEIEVKESSSLRKINYTPFNPVPFDQEDSVYDWTVAILSSKYEEWEYENEYRILHNEKYITKGFKITGIYLGARTSDTYKILIKKLVPNNVNIYETFVEYNQVKVKL